MSAPVLTPLIDPATTNIVTLIVTGPRAAEMESCDESRIEEIVQKEIRRLVKRLTTATGTPDQVKLNWRAATSIGSAKYERAILNGVRWHRNIARRMKQAGGAQ